MSKLRRVSFKKGRVHMPRLSNPYVPGVRHSRFWTEAQKDVLRKYYPDGGLHACLAHLPKHKQSRSGIYVMAHKLGLKSKKGGGPKQKLKLPKDIDDRIRAAWPLLDVKKRGAVNVLADRLKVPRWWLSHRARKLQLTMPHKKEPPWTGPENALMRKVPLHDPDKCAEIFRQHGFNRSPTAIVVRAKRLDLSRRYKEALSATGVAKILGMDSKTISTMCVAGEIKAGRRKTRRLPQQGGDWWTITPAELRRYILANLERVDLRKVEKFAFVQVVTGEPLP